MGKLIKIIIIAIISILLIVFILAQIFLNKNNSSLLFIAKKTPMLSGENCEQLQSKDDREICYGMAAVKTADVSYCEKITFLQNKYLCYSNVARNWKRIEYCNKAGFERERCINEYAEFNKDTSACDMHRDNKLVLQCKKDVK